MNHALKFAAVALAAGALVGCGGAKIQSKEEAAAVAFRSGNRGSDAYSKGAFLRLFQSAENFTGSVTVDCAHGGTASLRTHLDTNDLSSLGLFDLEFKGCVEPSYDDPQTPQVEQEDVVYDGQLTVKYSFTSASFEVTMKGRIDLGGAYSDFVQMDLTETLSSSQAGVTFVINGTVDSSSEHYVYNRETYEFTAEGKVVRGGNGT